MKQYFIIIKILYSDKNYGFHVMISTAMLAALTTAGIGSLHRILIWKIKIINYNHRYYRSDQLLPKFHERSKIICKLCTLSRTQVIGHSGNTSMISPSGPTRHFVLQLRYLTNHLSNNHLSNNPVVQQYLPNSILFQQPIHPTVHFSNNPFIQQ